MAERTVAHSTQWVGRKKKEGERTNGWERCGIEGNVLLPIQRKVGREEGDANKSPATQTGTHMRPHDASRIGHA